ncbi:MAG: hypothetical protein Q8K69_03060 [Bacteroidota bacterium]|nr:hypothetical protein [Bacteroidota bacterium]
MKTKTHLLILLLFSVFLIFGSGCTIIKPQQQRSKGVVIHSSRSGRIPPGQMKKMTGAKSAKQYAPGQQKKHTRK